MLFEICLPPNDDISGRICSSIACKMDSFVILFVPILCVQVNNFLLPGFDQYYAVDKVSRAQRCVQVGSEACDGTLKKLGSLHAGESDLRLYDGYDLKTYL